MSRPGISRKHTSRASRQLALAMAARPPRPLRKVFAYWLESFIRPLWLRRFARWVIFPKKGA